MATGRPNGKPAGSRDYRAATAAYAWACEAREAERHHRCGNCIHYRGGKPCGTCLYDGRTACKTDTCARWRGYR